MNRILSLLLGGKARFQDAKARPFPLRVVRWRMLLFVPLIYGFIYVVSAYTVPFFAVQLVTRPAALVLGTEVDVSAAHYNPLSRTITFNDFVVADPKNPGENLLTIGRASVDIGLIGLLQRRALINRASLETVALHVKREADGSLNLDNVGTGWDVEGYAKWLKRAGKVDWLRLLRRLWDAWRTRPPTPKPQPQPDLSGSHPFPMPYAWFALEHVGARRFEVSLTDAYGSGTTLPALRKAELSVENLELSPRYARKPVKIALKGEFSEMPGASIEVAVGFEPLGNGDFRTTFHFGLQNVDLTRFAPLYEQTLPTRLLQGTLTLAGNVTVDSNALSGHATIRLDALRLEKKPQHPRLFGLDPISTDYVLQGINRFAQDTPVEFAFNISGTTTQPHFGWEAAFLDVALQGLERQANLLLQPFIEWLKVKLQEAYGLEGRSPEPNVEDALNALQKRLQQMFTPAP